MTLPLDFCKPPAPHPRKWCGKEGKGDVKCCTKADFWGLNSGKIFLQKIISMCFPFFLSSCNGLKRISFLGHFCMESEQGSTAEPTKEGKSTHTLTQGSEEKRQARAANLQAAKKADGKTKPGTLAERNWDIAAPVVSNFKRPCLTTDACLRALHFTAAAWGYVFPSKHEQSCHEC